MRIYFYKHKNKFNIANNSAKNLERLFIIVAVIVVVVYLKTSFSSTLRKLGLDVCPISSLSIHISLKMAHSGCRPSNFMSFFTHSCFSAPAHTFHLHISARRHPIIPTLTLKMPRPSQFAMPYHISHAHTEYPEGCINLHCTFYPSRTLHIPSQHPLQTIQIHNLHSKMKPRL